MRFAVCIHYLAKPLSIILTLLDQIRTTQCKLMVGFVHLPPGFVLCSKKSLRLAQVEHHQPRRSNQDGWKFLTHMLKLHVAQHNETVIQTSDKACYDGIFSVLIRFTEFKKLSDLVGCHLNPILLNRLLG